MKKNIIITLISLISIISFTSCCNDTKNQELLEMRDSIQTELEINIDIQKSIQETIDSLLTVDLESLTIEELDNFEKELQANKYLRNEYQTKIDECNEKIFQIDLQLKK